MTTGKLEDIERRLASGELEDLFAETLGWGRLTHPPLLRPVGAPVNQEIKLTPLAQMGDLPVFRVHWPKDKPPTIAERRAVLRALHQAYHEHLLVYVTQNKDQLLFVWPKTVGEGRTARVELRALPYTRGEPARTTVERLALLGFSLDEVGRHGVPTIQVLDRLDRAFDVEAVTKQFFTDYRRLFEEVECQVDGVADTATRRLFVQSLFNRLLFIVFLERKGWLTFQGSRDYLRALWVDHLREKSRGEPSSFYRDRLKLLFFAGLNTPHEVDVVGIARNGFLQSRIGHVPYLNGGLFEESESDRDPDISVPDAALEPVIQELLYHYNFTVTESTPLDIEVAVDPEMLGRIFEELVTGRHESGSYYTPKQVVAFMCREALKDYLAVRCAREDHTAIASFVDDRDGTRLRNAEAVLAALRSVRVCDPACGSGAYLVGMLHELIDLRDALFVSRGLDPLSAYRRKLDVIQENLYGVDLDPFAVNIARLRLWLSLIVDFDDGAPPPLPNLDLKVEPGDSLTAPDPSAGLAAGFRKELVERVFELKAQYLMAHGGAKLRLREEIQSLTADIRAWAGRGPEAEGFDWAVEFAEVFSSGGFDIVITNPPYVRQELIRDAKPVLKRLYPDVYSGTADLYVYFYLRALQLLKPGGVLCFISSNKWMRAAYGERLRRHLSQDTTVQTIIDFGDLPVFTATAYPCIVLARKEKPSPQHTIQALTVTDISAVQRLAEEVGFRAWQQPQASMRPQGWSLARPAVLALMDKLRASGQPLGKHVHGRFYRGILTGFNAAFVI
ncbi:MAG: Eco57I restriction-modification methylase domain-containing protein, partial [Anaerolineae bacterium]